MHRLKGGRYEAEELGGFKQGKWWSHDCAVDAIGSEPMLFRRSGWQRTFHAEDPQGHPIGEHTRTDWIRASGPLMWLGVQYEFVRSSAWKGAFALTRYDEELALFTPDWRQRHITIELPTGADVPPGLLIFGMWITLMTQRDNAAAAG